jgi:3-oxoacyl-[acyl-carrier protein] reductase
MSDVLLDLGRNPRARRLVQALGLPIPLPQALRRERGPWSARPLADAKVAVGATAGAELAGVLAECLAAAGADAFLSMPAELAAKFDGPGETFGRPARPLEGLVGKARLDALVLDATGVRTSAGLRVLHDFFQPLVGALARSARVLVLGRSADAVVDAEQAAAQAALEGFVRSVAKEIGRGGSTANLVYVAHGAEDRIGPVVRFVLSARAAFVDGQPIVVTARAKALREPPLVRSLEKKVALVTGAARGIGEATARALAAEGAHVVCLDRPADDAATSQLARALGGTALLADVLAEDAPAKIAGAIRGLGGVDVIVHNAGVTRDKTLARMAPDAWDMVLGVNLGAIVRTTAALEPQLRDHGRVVCLSSIAGLAGNVGQTAYAASKAGVVGFVRATAERLADRGVTVNAVAPGFIETRMTAAVPLAIREVARRLSALGQGGQPEDVAQAITFLASPGAQGITGRTMRVCGGAFIGA